MGPPEALILALHQKVKFRDFVETGTYEGNTTAWAAKYFPQVTTIELSEKYHRAAVARFASQPTIRPMQGNSAAVLGEIVPTLTTPSLFWLDAHWSGLDTAGREVECPLLEEMALLNAASAEHTVLVDDARLFCAPPPRPHRAAQWPDLCTTVAALRDGGRRHVVLFEDVFVAVPASERDFLNGWIQDEMARPHTSNRLARWWKKIRA